MGHGGSTTSARGLRLHLGCGSFVVPGWENVDKSWNVLLVRVPLLRRALAAAGILTADQARAVFPTGIVRHDVRRGLPYPDGAARWIYSSHLIEHMSRWQALALLRECRRVLEPGGVLRLATPDLAALVDEYSRSVIRRGSTAADSFVEQLETYREQPGTRAQRFVQRWFTAPHQWLYDAESLVYALTEAGFEDARPMGFRESDLPDIAELEQRDESLFVEARRPAQRNERTAG
jgi:predicted SAM-dependent methyltransferase